MLKHNWRLLKLNGTLFDHYQALLEHISFLTPSALMTEIYVCRVGIFSAWNSMQLKIFSSLILSKISSRKLVFLFIQIKIHILFFRFVVSEILQTSNYNQNNTIEKLTFWWISTYWLEVDIPGNIYLLNKYEILHF